MDAFRSEYRIGPATLHAQEMIVVEDAGRAVAFAGGLLQGDCLFVDFLFVAPEAMGKALGSLLLQRLTDKARAAGRSRLMLESDHFAKGFYEDRGFRVISERPSQMSPNGVIPLMEKRLEPEIHALKSVDLTVDLSAPWEFETARRPEIEAHWAEACRANPYLWDGRTLKMTDYRLRNGHLTGTLRECAFSAFLAWRDWGAPDLVTRNIFGSAIVRSADGALLYGVMSDKTANAGKVYPPGGNLDPEMDMAPDGRVDILGAIYRELEEETGLKADETRAGPLFTVFDGPRVAVALVLDVPEAAAPLRRRIIEHSRLSDEQELSDIRILRGPDDLATPDLVPFCRDLGMLLLAGN
jgi:GNAT superfamily N-acetyltransferase/8-oxo-dGTP pyrophosphatase MutT (NUDIX family)